MFIDQKLEDHYTTQGLHNGLIQIPFQCNFTPCCVALL